MHPNSRKTWWWRFYVPALLWWLLSLYLFLLPGSQFKTLGWMNRFHVDKLVHFVLFAGLVYLLYRPVLKRRVAGYKASTLLIIPVLAVVYGIAIEFIQKEFVPFRSFDGGDVLFDALGALLPAVLLYKRMKKLTHQSQGSLVRGNDR